MFDSNLKIPLAKILDLEVNIDVVDIGASPSGGAPPYQFLIDNNCASVVGFEPDQEALDVLNNNKKATDIYLPYAVGDGEMHEFKHCAAPEMSSLLEPNFKVLDFFHSFSDFARVVKRQNITTKKLDEIREIKNIDLLKIDIQGGELIVFENAIKRLRNCCVIHTEVEFIELYLKQPLFSEIELFLRGLGFVFHKFVPLRSRVFKPMLVENSRTAGLSQIFDGDALFIRDFTKYDKTHPDRLLKSAIILHDLYHSLDVVYQLLDAFDRRRKTKLAAKYMAAISQ